MTTIDVPPPRVGPPLYTDGAGPAPPGVPEAERDATVIQITGRVAARLPHVAPAEIAVLVHAELHRREGDRVQTYTNVLVERSVIERLRRSPRNDA